MPGEYQDFQISVDPLPGDTSQLVFKAVQTYSDGDVVRWIDLSSSADPDPEHPAPVLTLTPASGTDSSTGATTAATTAAGSGSDAAAASPSSSSSGSNGLGIAGLVLGAIGAVCGAAALFSTRKARRNEAP